jgi:hypothetical protein
METSDKIDAIAKALKEFHKTVEAVKKDATNPFFKSKYASLENVIATIEEPLGACGLSWAQFPDGDGLTTVITHESGQWMRATANLELKGHTPQDQGSAITYMRRYALSAALGLATETDDDGNAATVAAKAKPAVSAAEKKEQGEKQQIVDLCHAKSVDAPLLSKGDIKNFILKSTGLVYGEAKNTEIIERLKAI